MAGLAAALLAGAAEGAGGAGRNYYEHQYKNDAIKERDKIAADRQMALAKYRGDRQVDLAGIQHENRLTEGNQSFVQRLTADNISSGRADEREMARAEREDDRFDRTQSAADRRHGDLMSQRDKDREAQKSRGGSIQTDANGNVVRIGPDGKSVVVTDAETGKPLKTAKSVPQARLKQADSMMREGLELMKDNFNPEAKAEGRALMQEARRMLAGGKDGGSSSGGDKWGALSADQQQEMTARLANVPASKRDKAIERYRANGMPDEAIQKALGGGDSQPQVGPSNNPASPSKRNSLVNRTLGAEPAPQPEQPATQEAQGGDAYQGIPRFTTRTVRARGGDNQRQVENPEFAKKVAADLFAEAQKGNEKALALVRRVGAVGINDNIDEALSILNGGQQ